MKLTKSIMRGRMCLTESFLTDGHWVIHKDALDAKDRLLVRDVEVMQAAFPKVMEPERDFDDDKVRSVFPTEGKLFVKTKVLVEEEGYRLRSPRLYRLFLCEEDNSVWQADDAYVRFLGLERVFAKDGMSAGANDLEDTIKVLLPVMMNDNRNWDLVWREKEENE